MKRITAYAIGLFLVSTAFSQTRVVRGDLTVFNNYGVQNVNVVSKKAKSSVITDSMGHFELVCKEKDIIQVKGPVFASLSRRVNKNDDYVKANLIFKDTEENRKIATGMGYISEERLTYALANLKHENNDFCNYSDVFALIKGKFPGVEVRVTPTGEQGVFIRGTKSLLGDNEAIYVIDDMRVYDISSVFPCDITDITVLKDGGAALYGSDGATGVVVIKTKASVN